MKFLHNTTVKMYDTDAAGILYFASQFRFVHDAFESFLNHHEIFLKDMLSHKDYMFVIVHTESDYLEPVYLGDELTIELSVSKIGQTSVTFSYNLFRSSSLVGRAKTVHVAINSKSRQKIEIPKHLLDKFQYD